MTIFGAHTMDETEHLMKTVEFRIQAANKVNLTIPVSVAGTPDGVLLQQDWSDFKTRWTNLREKVLNKLLGRKLAQPLVSATIIDTEPEYQLIDKGIAVGKDGSPAGNLMDCITRIETQAGTRIDEKDAPMPSGFDPDFAGYKAVDAAIKKGEIAAADAAKKAGELSKTNVGLIVGVVGVALVGTVVVTKIYL